MHRAAMTATAAAAITAATGAVHASNIQWTWNVGDPPGSYGINNAGGTFESVHAEFNPATQRFHWTTVFSDQVTEGFTLAVSPGPNPKGHAGELALLYFDASDMGAPTLTAYAYNGKNAQNSYIDGNANVSGDQTPDLIMDASKSAWITSISATDSAGKRVLSFTIDAADINAHGPMYPDATDPWYGIGFGAQLGLWMHPFRSFDPEYGQDGRITALNARNQGWFDGHSFETPTPGSLALASMGGLLLIGRRRRGDAH